MINQRRVVFIVPTMALGGAERQLHLLMRHLDRGSFVPVLVTLNTMGEFYERAIEDGVECHHLALRGWFPLKGFMRLIRLLRNPLADIVVMRGFNATILGRLAALLAGVPVRIVSEHSTGWVKRRGAFMRLVDRSLTPATTLYIAVAEAQRDFLVSERHLPEQRICVIHNGIERSHYGHECKAAARAILGIDDGAFVVGIVAVLRPEKDHITFLEAANELLLSVPTGRFVIVGDGPCRPMVEDRVIQLGLEGRVHLTGARTDVERLLPAFDVFTLSSYTIETFPMSVLEAMSCRLPIVATSVGGLPEMVDHGRDGLLVPARDSQALAAAWLTLFQDESLRRDMGSNAGGRVEKEFTAEKMARRYEAVLSQLPNLRGRG